MGYLKTPLLALSLLLTVGFYFTAAYAACSDSPIKPETAILPCKLTNNTTYITAPSKYIKNRQASFESSSIKPNSTGIINFKLTACPTKIGSTDLYSSVSLDFRDPQGKIVDTCTFSLSSSCEKTQTEIQKKADLTQADCLRENLKATQQQDHSWVISPK